jgi:hypothetical protein
MPGCCAFGRTPTCSTAAFQRAHSGAVKKKKPRTVSVKMQEMLARVGRRIKEQARVAAGRPPPQGPDAERYGYSNVFALIAELAGRAGDTEFMTLWRVLVERYADDACDFDGAIRDRPRRKFIKTVFEIGRKVVLEHEPGPCTKQAKALKKLTNTRAVAHKYLIAWGKRFDAVAKTHSDDSPVAQSVRSSVLAAKAAFEDADLALHERQAEVHAAREVAASADWQQLATLLKPGFDGGDALLRSALAARIEERDGWRLESLVRKQGCNRARPAPNLATLYAHYKEGGAEAHTARPELGGRTLFNVFQDRGFEERLDELADDPPTALWLHLPAEREQAAFPSVVAVFNAKYKHIYARAGLDVATPDPNRAPDADEAARDEARSQEIEEEDEQAEVESEVESEAPPEQDEVDDPLAIALDQRVSLGEEPEPEPEPESPTPDERFQMGAANDPDLAHLQMGLAGTPPPAAATAARAKAAASTARRPPPKRVDKPGASGAAASVAIHAEKKRRNLPPPPADDEAVGAVADARGSKRAGKQRA